MVDKYQIYMLYKTIKKMWKARRFNTVIFQDFFDDTLENYIINQYISDGRGVEYMSNYAIKLVNEIACGITDIEHWMMYVLMKCICDKECPKLQDINSISKLANYKVFEKRAIIRMQAEKIRMLIDKYGSGLNEFTDTGFSLYRLDGKQENEAYRMYMNDELDPEFFIRGMQLNKFGLDMDVIKDNNYRRFITFTKMILKLQKEISDKNNVFV